MDLRPWQLWTVDGKPVQDTEEIVTVLESVLQRDPDHIGANHYYIHAMEASPHPERALPSASAAGDAGSRRGPPGSYARAHLLPHRRLRTHCREQRSSRGRGPGVCERDQRSGDVSADVHVAQLSFPDVFAACRRAAFRTPKMQPPRYGANVAPHADMMPSFMADQFLATPAFVLLRFNRWSEILALPQPDPKNPVLAALSHFARGSAFAATGDVKSAESERKALASTVTGIPADTPLGYNMAKDVAGTLAGKFWTRALRKLRETARRRSIPCARPCNCRIKWPTTSRPIGIIPCANRWAARCCAMGRPPKRKKCFAKICNVTRETGVRYLDCGRACWRRRRMTDADWARREFMVAWKSADTQLRIEDL